MNSIILAALIAATPAPSPAPTHVPGYVDRAPRMPSPSVAYTPIPCDKIITAAKLQAGRINADHVGALLTAALKAHGYDEGLVPSQAFGRSVVDLTACRIFRVAR